MTVINAPVSNTTLSINQAAKNVARNQAAPSSRVSSAQDDPDNCFNKIQLHWKMLRKHRDTDLYWFCHDDPASLSKNSGIITEWLLLLLVELDIPTPPGVKWTGHSLCRGDDSETHDIGVSIAVIMVGAYGSLSLQRSSTSTSRCGRPQKLSSSSATCFRASIFLKRHSFDKLHQQLGARRST